MADQSVDLIAGFEGFRPDAYWDVNHWRVGYGSDTVTNADGSVSKVTKNTKTTAADAARDLARRVPEFQQGIIKSVGADAWAKLDDQSKAAVTSVAYNYGGIHKLPTLKAAIKTGTPTAISSAIQSRAVDNGSVNAKRRATEAAVAAGHPIPPMNVPNSSVAGAPTNTTEVQRALSSAGFSPGSVDGIKGPKTLAAIKSFQAANGLVPDGIVGPKTQAALASHGVAASGVAQGNAAISANAPFFGATAVGGRATAQNGRGVAGTADLTRTTLPAQSTTSHTQTQYIQPDGTLRTVQPAGTVAMPPGARPAIVNSLAPGGMLDAGGLLRQQPSAAGSVNLTNAPRTVLPAAPPAGAVAPANAMSRTTLPASAPDDSVRQAQQALTAWGMPTTADGVYGPQTRAAVVKFQTMHGLVPDGIIGPKTAAELVTKPVAAPAAPAMARTTLPVNTLARPARPVPVVQQQGGGGNGGNGGNGGGNLGYITPQNGMSAQQTHSALLAQQTR